MEALYLAAGLSRQAFHDWRQPSEHQQGRTPERLVVELARHIRKTFLPGSSAREVYFFIRNKQQATSAVLSGWGKHTFEALCLNNGFRIETRRFVPKTTVRGDYIFPNLIEGSKITDINRIWASDICYLYGANGGALIGYATTLIDLYSRRLLGLAFSQTMHAAVTSCEVIRQAFVERPSPKMPELVFHSDGGKQYIESNFLKEIRAREIRSSMADSCYQNAFAEAFNDILKNHILYDLDINSFPQLKKPEAFVKHVYNHNRPHGSIGRLTPCRI